ncbi:hypothetical protein EDE12_1122 [Methylosinus sp. sav-2]|uniref:hypothetical protein n=1 Tax=Methylosinus sp. sav-2 TaxID=2485168 RepID=UPI00047ABC2E|nr:hypothetical protein [Methylosinus sp. sav-2]TDX61901.1 hypothetical protein EDE12_1122 [Methylosinus sp. sav-2]
MIGLVELFAAQIEWHLARNNVVVEGTSDVAFLTHAADLHAQAHGRSILDADFSIVAAGKEDDGGVDGVNRRLNTMRQLADADRDLSGALRHRFVGLLDNDQAGRSAFNVACSFDRRIEPYVDIFLLHPIMPHFGANIADRRMEMARINRPFARMDWEIEDLCSERILIAFEQATPGAVLARETKNGRVHREFEKKAKRKLKQFFIENATVDDAREFLVLLQTLRNYLDLTYNYIDT